MIIYQTNGAFADCHCYFIEFFEKNLISQTVSQVWISDINNGCISVEITGKYTFVAPLIVFQL